MMDEADDLLPEWLTNPSDDLRVRNHWIPQTYLRRFTGDGSAGGGFWMYDREDPDNPRPVTPRRVANENYLYVTESAPPDFPRDLMERLLSYIEKPYSAIYCWLVRGREVGLSPRMPPEQEFGLALFVAMQHLRTPYWRDRYEWMASFHAALSVRSRLEDLEAARLGYREATGKEISLGSLRRMRRQLDAGDLLIKPSKGLWIASFAKHAIELAEEVIIELPRRVVETPSDIALPTSDLPVSIWTKDESGFIQGGGLIERDAEVALPLDPHHVLLIGAAALEQTAGTRDWSTGLAQRLAANSERFVFSRERNLEISRWLQESDPPTHVVEFSGKEYPTAGPAGPVVKDLLDSKPRYLRFGPSFKR